jgi:hypothetical protein
MTTAAGGLFIVFCSPTTECCLYSYSFYFLLPPLRGYPLLLLLVLFVVLVTCSFNSMFVSFRERSHSSSHIPQTSELESTLLDMSEMDELCPSEEDAY